MKRQRHINTWTNKVKVRTTLTSMILVLFSISSQATSTGASVSKEHFENECITEIDARKKHLESNKFCSAYIIGFLDGANNPQGCEVKDLTYFIKRFVLFSQKQNNEYFGAVVKSFVARGCKAL